nr:PREDICTED: centrosome-associated protein 350 [Struthio camelus australis]
MAEKQRKILTELKQEQAEIQHLQNICKAAHQERKLLLKQQREILMMRRSTAQLQEELNNLTGKQEFTRRPATEEAIKQKTMRLISSPMLCSISAKSTAQLERPGLSGNRESCVQLKNKQSKTFEGLSTENKKPLVQYQKRAEESPGSEQSLGVQAPGVSETVDKNLCDATGQNTGLLFMVRDHNSTELSAQDHVFLNLEHANSARIDEAISTPIPREGKKYALPESVLEEKAFVSSPKVDPKNNKDINPCDSKFTVKGLGMLSTWCNLCLVQAENTLQETGESTSPVVEELEDDSLTVEKVRRKQRSHETREEQDSGSPFQAGRSKKHLSSDGDEDGERGSQLISDGGAVVKTQLRKERSSEEQRISTDSERKSEITHIDEKSPSAISLSQGGSAKSDSSLPEFQKVSAIWIDISESSTSDSELEVKNGEDTDVSILEEFAYNNGDVFPNISTETLLAINNRKETLCGDKHDEQVPKDGCSPEISSLCQSSQKYPGNVPDHGCSDHFLYFIPSDKGNTSKTNPPHSFRSDNPAKRMDEPHLEASENYGTNDTSSQEISEQDKEAGSSSWYSDEIYSTKKICAQQDSSSTASRVKKDGEISSISVDQNTELTGFLLTDPWKRLDLVIDQFSNTVSFPPEKSITNDKLVACLSPRDLSVSEGENNQTQLLNEQLASSKLSKIVSLPTSMPGISEEAHTETEICSYEPLQKLATGNQNNSTTERRAIKEMERGLLSSDSSKEQLFQAENYSSKGEDDAIFISDEGLLPTDEDTLSEILSPVDEVLSYGSADLPSSGKKDLSFPSEDSPPPPLGADAMKNDDSSFSTDDFPSPPEQMIFSETRQCMDEAISLKMDALPPLPDNIVPEEFPLLNPEPTVAFSTQDGNLSEQSLFKEHISTDVPNPISSDEASKNTESVKKQCKTHLTLPKAEEDSDDPLLSFEIGDRVLVKKTQPGTLMFKGQTYFDSGYWAGVALDKAEGDNAGTYQGVKYFECAQHCGIFVRPDQISHLLEANENGSNPTEDEDSDSFHDGESFQGDCKYTEDDKQGAGFTEQKAEDTNNARSSEVKEKQSRLHIALLSGTGQQFPNSRQCKSNEFLCQNNLMCLQSDKEKTELTQIKQRIPADVLPVKNKTRNTDEGNISKNVCCLVEDQKRSKLADDITSELSKKLLFDTLVAFSETAQHKYKSAFEKEVMNYGKGPQQEDNQKRFLFKENPADSLSEQSAKVSDVFLCDFDMLSIHGCHTVAERIVTKFVDDAVKEYEKIKRKQGAKADKIFPSSSDSSPTASPFLIKILDAGIFGSSEDFDQLNSDQRTLERQTLKQNLYKLDQWHSAPWKKTVEVPLVVPHCSSYVKKLSAHAVEELWTPENMPSNCKRISVPKHFECHDFSENNLETESKRMYNQIIFDLTHELLCAEYHVTANPNTFPWLKENLGSCCSRRLCGRTDVNEVKVHSGNVKCTIMRVNEERRDCSGKMAKT